MYSIFICIFLVVGKIYHLEITRFKFYDITIASRINVKTSLNTHTVYVIILGHTLNFKIWKKKKKKKMERKTALLRFYIHIFIKFCKFFLTNNNKKALKLMFFLLCIWRQNGKNSKQLFGEVCFFSLHDCDRSKNVVNAVIIINMYVCTTAYPKINIKQNFTH